MQIIRWASKALRSAEGLHGGQLVILWIVLSCVAYGSLVGLEAFVKWRFDRYNESIEAENYWRKVDQDSCEKAIPPRLALGALAERHEKLRNDTFPASRTGTLWYELHERGRPAARAALRALNDSLGPDTVALRATRDTLLELRNACRATLLYADDPPREEPFRALFFVIAFACASVALASTWFWLGARK